MNLYGNGRNIYVLCTRFNYRKAESQIFCQVAASQFHYFFSQLVWPLSANVNYLFRKLPKNASSLIFRAQGGLFYLNFIPRREQNAWLCSLCNTKERKNMPHFIGRCAVLGGTRGKWLGSATLSDQNVIEWLNGRDWAALVSFIREAMLIRTELTNEFNN